jgi:hypothetical protein
VHVEAFGVERSASKTYTVRWLVLTNPGLPLIDAVVSGAVAGGAVGPPVGRPPYALVDPPPPQAASETTRSAEAQSCLNMRER